MFFCNLESDAKYKRHKKKQKIKSIKEKILKTNKNKDKKHFKFNGDEVHMQLILYPLLASKVLNHCKIFLDTMKKMENEEVIELAFNEFIANSDRVIQYLQKELKLVGGDAPTWFKNERDRLPLGNLFYDLRHIINHHFFIPLTPILEMNPKAVPPHNIQLTQMRLDLELLPEDKKFNEKKSQYISNVGPSVNAIELSEKYFNILASFLSEAENKYGNDKYYKRHKIKSNFRVNSNLTLTHL